MKKVNFSFKEQVAQTSPAIQQEISMGFAIADRICELMEKRQLTKAELAEALDKRPCEVAQWLSGQHNFTIKTIAQLSAFFGEPLLKM